MNSLIISRFSQSGSLPTMDNGAGRRMMKPNLVTQKSQCMTAALIVCVVFLSTMGPHMGCASPVAQDDASVPTLVDWVKREGGYISPKIDIQPSENKHDLEGGMLGHDAGSGLFAKKDIAIGHRLFSIPFSCIVFSNSSISKQLFKSLNASTEPFADEITMHDVQILSASLQLLRERADRTSFFQPYLEAFGYDTVLPPEKLGMFWTSNELRLLDKTDAKENIENVHAKFEVMYSHFVRFRGMLGIPFPHSIFNYENIKHAYALGKSRTLGYMEDTRVFVPVNDMINHKPSTKTLSLDYRLQRDKGVWAVYASSSYKEGEEIFETYNALPNWSLLSGFGFVLDDNPHDTVTLRLDHYLWDEEEIGWDRAYILTEVQRKLGLKASLPRNQIMQVEVNVARAKKSKISEELMIFARLAMLKIEKWHMKEQIMEGLRLDDENEILALRWLQSGVASELKARGMTVDLRQEAANASGEVPVNKDHRLEEEEDEEDEEDDEEEEGDDEDDDDDDDDDAKRGPAVRADFGEPLLPLWGSTNELSQIATALVSTVKAEVSEMDRRVADLRIKQARQTMMEDVEVGVHGFEGLAVSTEKMVQAAVIKISELKLLASVLYQAQSRVAKILKKAKKD